MGVAVSSLHQGDFLYFKTQHNGHLWALSLRSLVREKKSVDPAQRNPGICSLNNGVQLRERPADMEEVGLGWPFRMSRFQ